MKLSKLLAIATSSALALSITGFLTLGEEAKASTAYSIPWECTLTSGDGSSGNPFEVFTVTDLLGVAGCVDSATSDIYFEQKTNIYLDPTKNYPSVQMFLYEGGFSYDGGGFGIFGFSSSGGDPAGLFSSFDNQTNVTETVTVKDLFLEVKSLVGEDRVSNGYTGSVLGSTLGVDVVIENVHVSADYLEGGKALGGIVGSVERGTVQMSSSSVKATAMKVNNSHGFGGLVAGINSTTGNSRIVDSMVLADLTVDAAFTNPAPTGGLVGAFNKGTLTIERSMFRGNINGNSGSEAHGGLVGEIRSRAEGSSNLIIRDSVAEASISGESSLGGFLGYGYLFAGAPDANLTVTNSIFSGTLSSFALSQAGGGIIGEAQDTNLVVDNVVLDVTFAKNGSSTPSGNYVSDPPKTRTITDLYVNYDKVAQSQWTLTDLTGQGNWGATLVSAANFGLSTSFPALTFAAPNGAPTPGTFEVCPSGVRPFHSIESSSCSTPAIDYPASLNLDFGDFANTGFVGDAANYLYFTVSPSLPKGLALNTFTGEIFGQALQGSATNNYTITATAANGSVQDTISISVGAASGQITLKPNLDSFGADQTRPLGILELPTNPFGSSQYALAGWSVGSPTGPILVPGSEILATVSTDVYAVWAIGPDCAANSGAAAGSFFELCKDPNGRKITVSDSVSDGSLSYFIAETPPTGGELWVTDGTAAGTRLLFEGEPGSEWGAWNLLGFVNGRLIYEGSMGGTTGLFSTDGSLANTIRLASNTFGIAGFASFGSKAVFTSYSQANGYELWATDGTAAGTQELVDLEPGGGDSYPDDHVLWQGDVYFSADTTTNGQGEVFVTDGSASGTSLAFEIVAGAGDGRVSNLRVVNDKLFFEVGATGQEGLWVIADPQGTPQRLVAGSVRQIGQSPDGLKAVFGLDPNQNNDENELWISDGTLAGTQKVKELAPAGVDTNPRNFNSVGDTLYFNANLANGDTAAWVTDQTSAGTVRILETLDSPIFEGTIGGVVFGEYKNGSGVEVLLRSPISSDSQQLGPQQPAQQPAAGSSGQTGPITTIAPVFDQTSGMLKISGTNLSQVYRVEISGQILFSKFESGVLHVMIPRALAIGNQDIIIVSSAGRLTIQHRFAEQAQASSSDFIAWTKRLDDGTAKIYAKNVIQAGKVQFMMNGEEVAWVRAEDETDAKLRVAHGAHYLVRTVKLDSGKNALEIYLDGERQRRVAYTR